MCVCHPHAVTSCDFLFSCRGCALRPTVCAFQANTQCTHLSHSCDHFSHRLFPLCRSHTTKLSAHLTIQPAAGSPLCSIGQSTLWSFHSLPCTTHSRRNSVPTSFLYSLCLYLSLSSLFFITKRGEQNEGYWARMQSEPIE